MKRQRQKAATPSLIHNRIVWALVAGIGLFLAVVFLVINPESYEIPEDIEPEIEGAPRISMISDEVVDYGDVPLNTTIKTEFRFRNTGDQPLKVQGEPVVELVRGC